MADTRAQRNAEEWIATKFLPGLFPGETFERKRLSLVWGGEFQFDAVNQSNDFACLISTSASKTKSGKFAVAKALKVKADCFYLMNCHALRRRAHVFADLSMLEHFAKEVARGRFPPEVQLVHAVLPAVLQRELMLSRNRAAAEVSPRPAS